MSKLKIAQDILDIIYPIGSIYINTININPSKLFGGVWEEFATGRTLVGIDPNQEEFNELGKTGGYKQHELTIDELPSHSHQISVPIYKGQNLWGIPSYHYLYDTFQPTNITSNSVGKNKPHNNLQPYITVYMWNRIS